MENALNIFSTPETPLLAVKIVRHRGILVVTSQKQLILRMLCLKGSVFAAIARRRSFIASISLGQSN